MNDDTVMFCTFEAAGRLFGVPLADIKEITAEINCTPIPHAPDSVRGYVNIRGQIILGLDLKRILKLPIPSLDVAKRLVIFKSAIGPAFGLLVDEIGEIASVSQSELQVQDRPHSRISLSGPTGLIDQVCQLPNQLLVVLNPRKFLPIIEQELSQSST